MLSLPDKLKLFHVKNLLLFFTKKSINSTISFLVINSFDISFTKGSKLSKSFLSTIEEETPLNYIQYSPYSATNDFKRASKVYFMEIYLV